MRLNSLFVKEREEFLYNFVKDSPTVQAKELNPMLKEKFGKVMSPDRLYVIFKAAKSGAPLPPAMSTEARKELAAKRLAKREAKAAQSNPALVSEGRDVDYGDTVVTAQSGEDGKNTAIDSIPDATIVSDSVSDSL